MSDPKKSLMPEILPDPKHATTSASPRDRVVRHMKQLLTGAALGGISVSAGCFTAVDPAPQPATCQEPWDAPDIKASAIRGISSGGEVVDVLVVADQADTLFGDPTNLTGATLRSKSPGRGSLSLVLVPDADATAIEFDLEAKCATGAPPQPNLHVKIDLSTAEPDAGNDLPTELTRQ